MKPTIYKSPTSGDLAYHKFDIETGEETIGFFVHDNVLHMLKWLPSYDDPKAVLINWSLAWIGRSSDEVLAIGVKVHEDTERVEIRLRFAPPWYWDQVRERLQSAESRATDTREVSAV